MNSLFAIPCRPKVWEVPSVVETKKEEKMPSSREVKGMSAKVNSRVLATTSVFPGSCGTTSDAKSPASRLTVRLEVDPS